MKPTSFPTRSLTFALVLAAVAIAARAQQPASTPLGVAQPASALPHSGTPPATSTSDPTAANETAPETAPPGALPSPGFGGGGFTTGLGGGFGGGVGGANLYGNQPLPGGPGSGGGGGIGYVERFQAAGESRWGPSHRSPSIILTHEKEPAAVDELSEDLSVFLVLIQKNLNRLLDSSQAPLGVPLMVTGQRGAGASYVEGYGAVFTVTVDFPLIDVPKSKPAAEGEQPDSEWEKARRQLYGASEGSGDESNGGLPSFEARRVESVRDQLMSDLRFASHLRHVAAGESITIVVQGNGRRTPAARRALRMRTPGGINGSYMPEEHAAGPTRATYLTLSARKSEIDAWPKGVPLDRLQKTVTTTTYLGPALAQGGAEDPFGTSNNLLRR